MNYYNVYIMKNALLTKEEAKAWADKGHVVEEAI